MRAWIGSHKHLLSYAILFAFLFGGIYRVETHADARIRTLEERIAEKDETISDQQSVIDQAIAEVIRLGELCLAAPDCEPGEIVIKPKD